jgi:hypothetical protein
VLEVDTASQRRDVAAALVAQAATTVLPGVALEMGRGFGEGSGRWDWPKRSLALAGGPGVVKEGRARCLDRHKLGPNLGQGWVEPDTSIQIRRTAGARHNGPTVQSD